MTWFIPMHKTLMNFKMFLMMLVLFPLNVYGGGVPVIPNEALITGSVCGYCKVSSRLLNIKPEQVIYRLTVTVDSSEDVEGMPNLVKEVIGEDITLESKEEIGSDIFGKRVRVRVRVVGDEKGRRFWINSISIIH